MRSFGVAATLDGMTETHDHDDPPAVTDRPDALIDLIGDCARWKTQLAISELGDAVKLALLALHDESIDESWHKHGDDLFLESITDLDCYGHRLLSRARLNIDEETGKTTTVTIRLSDPAGVDVGELGTARRILIAFDD